MSRGSGHESVHSPVSGGHDTPVSDQVSDNGTEHSGISVPGPGRLATGKIIKMRTDTVCIHGDTPGAVEIGRGVRQALKDAGIAVAPFRTAR